MNSSSLKQHILDNIYGNEGLSRHQLQEKLARLGIDIEKTTLIRHLNKLVKSGELSRYGKGRATIYQQEDSLDAFFAKPPHLRPPVGYDVGIIERYRSDNGYFNRSELELLARNSEFKIANASTYLKNLYAKLVVDFSYASCHLEGNTYSFMDTQALIEHGEVAAGKSEEETIMVLNHRNAIDYLFANLATIRLTSSTIKEIHAILSLDLIQRHYVGVLRNGFVGIGASSYTPLANQDQLTDELELLQATAEAIENPFEQSFFLLAHLSHLQAFWDVNKRTARLAANILLLKYNLFPLSFLAMNKRDYVKGLLAFYELHQVEPLKKAYMDGYLESIDRYKQKADVLRASSRATLIFRNSIRIGVQRYVYNFPQLSVSTVAEKIFDDVHLSEEDKAYLAEAKIDGARFLTREIEEAMESMNEANCIAYGLSREDWLVYIKKQKWEVELPQ